MHGFTKTIIFNYLSMLQEVLCGLDEIVDVSTPFVRAGNPDHHLVLALDHG